MDPSKNQPDPYVLDAQMMADLWIFRAVGRHGSITSAADRLGVTQGAVSQRITRLEARLAATLFTRGEGRLRLTSAGNQLLAAMDNATLTIGDALGKIDDGDANSIVVSCPITLAAEWLAPRSSEFTAMHGIELMLRSDDTGPSRTWMEDCSIDVAIHVQRAEPVGLEVLGEFCDYIFPVCTPDYAEEILTGDGKSGKYHILHNDLPFRQPNIDLPEWQVWIEHEKGDWLRTPDSERYFNILQVAYHAAVAGEGIAMARAVCINRLLTLNALTIFPGARPMKSTRYMVLALNQGRKRSPVRKFANWLLHEMHATQSDTLDQIAFPDAMRLT